MDSSKQSNSTVIPDRLPFHLRPDIQWKEVQSESSSEWIATDPWSSEFHRCSEEDYQIFQWLAHERNPAKLAANFKRRFRPRTIESAEVIALVQRGVALGILRKDSTSATDFLSPKGGSGTNFSSHGGRNASVRERNKPRSALLVWSTFIVRMFQARISLGDPSRWLNKLTPIAVVQFSTMGYTALGMLLGFAGLIVASRWETLATELPSWQQLRSPQTWIGYGVLFLLTRAVHELGHAFACLRYGVRVRDFGLLSNFAMLCPYVDITESWKCERPSQRIVIALGGILSELWLAALAGLVWAFTLPGFVHETAFQTMLICSLTTLLFNANPLMKYDGYYVLCDLTGKQNLREKSWEAFDAFWESRFETTVAQTVLLAAYFIASLINRTVILVGIAALVYSIASQWRVAGIGLLLTAIYLVSQLIICISRGMEKAAIKRSPKHSFQFQAIGWASVAAMAFFSVTMPLPSRVRTLGTFTQGETSPIYAPDAGRLAWLVDVSQPTELANHQPVVKISDEALERSYLASRSRWVQSSEQLEAKIRSSFYDAKILEEIPLLRSQIALHEAQLKELGDRCERMSIHTPKQGVFHLASFATSETRKQDGANRPNRVAEERISNDLQNGEMVSQGTLLGWVHRDGAMQIETSLSEEDIAKIGIGTKAKVRSLRFPRQILWATVSEIAFAASIAEAAPNASKRPQLVYRVNLKVRTEGLESEVLSLVHSSTAEVCFHCNNRSLWDDGLDLLMRNLRIR